MTTYPRIRCTRCQKRFHRGGNKECPAYEEMLVSFGHVCLSFEYDGMDERAAEKIRRVAQQEIDDELVRFHIDQQKERIKARKPFLSRLFPWKITITRR